ncbi:HAMP domain-containing sensor histidine kinase [Bacillus sp. JJ722]|uniref:HAMP domain-containing sensor histidine kinase n=1 Tax=Bacillus sp. JJ722 TaxID=3122973 RepID=UPI002FFFDDE1
MKLGTRIHLLTTLLVFLLLIITNTAVYLIYKKITIDAELKQLHLTAINTIDSLNTGISKNIDIDDLFLMSFLPPEGMLRIAKDNKKKPIEAVATNNTYHNLKIPNDSKEFSKVMTMNNRDNTKFAVVSVPFVWKDGEVVSLQVVQNIDHIYQNLQSLSFILIVSSAIVIVAAFFAGRMLSTLILTPIKRMTATMKDIQKSRSFKKLKIDKMSKDELYAMADTFNGMMDILHDNFYKQQQFVSDASHELKTPLTVVESYAKMLKRWGRKREDILDEAIEAISSEAERMKMMTNQMLNLAKSEEMWDVEMKMGNIRPIIEATVKQLQRTYNRDITVSFNKDEYIIPMHEQGMKQLILILLDNARKYSDSIINVDVSEDETTLAISISDRGIGIPIAELPHIFDRFYRVDKVRSRETGGTGLGLSIAKQIVTAHSGTIKVNSEEGKGTTFVILIPRKGALS